MTLFALVVSLVVYAGMFYAAWRNEELEGAALILLVTGFLFWLSITA